MIQFPVTVLHRERGIIIPVLGWADTAMAAENNGLMFVKPLDTGLLGSMIRISDEGVGWVHGHHSHESSEVQAMLAAWALG